MDTQTLTRTPLKGRVKIYDRNKIVSLLEEEFELLRRLGRKMDLSDSGVIRRAIRELAQREGVE